MCGKEFSIRRGVGEGDFIFTKMRPVDEIIPREKVKTS